MTQAELECENCGMVGQPLVRDHCAGCICQKCERTAAECGGSMNDMGWCDDCESLLELEVNMKQKSPKPRRRWVGGVSMGKLRLAHTRALYYFLDDRGGGRWPATALEVALWRKAIGPIPYGSDKPVLARTKRKARK